MAAYVVVKLEITDPERFKTYRQLLFASVEKFGGKFLVRGGAAMVELEGSWDAPRMMVLEFASLELTTSWYHSLEYGGAIEARKGAATFHRVALEGITPESETPS